MADRYCPECDTKLLVGARRCKCGWGTESANLSPAERRRADFDALPPCYRCAGTGITLRRTGRYGACGCARGQWMRANGELFSPEIQPTRDLIDTFVHPDIEKRHAEQFPDISGGHDPNDAKHSDPDFRCPQCKAIREARYKRLGKQPVLKPMPGEPGGADLEAERNRQIQEARKAS